MEKNQEKTSDISDKDLQVTEHLKASIWLSVETIIQAELEGKNIKVTPEFVAGLTNFVYNKTIGIGKDLEHFARHANRNKITTDDVRLLCRNNQSLLSALDEFQKSNNT